MYWKLTSVGDSCSIQSPIVIYEHRLSDFRKLVSNDLEQKSASVM
jgi:hypothetical protein